MKRIDLEGKEFPHFKVLRPIHIKYKGKNILHWECLCECGSVFHATARSIVTEKVKSCSCGCYQKKYQREKHLGNQKKYQREKHLGNGRISIGDTFGLLIVKDTVVGEDGNTLYNTLYVCQCECGNMITLSGSHLVKRYSFGCMSKECIKGTNINVASFTHLGKKTKRNASGCTGVSFVTAKSKWMAQIYFNGKKKFLGYFDNKEDAIKARREAENDIYSLFSDVIDKLPNKNNAFSIREEK